VRFALVQALTGLASASSLFLVSAGLTVVFGVTRVVNFAHGSLAMVGAYAAWSVFARLAPGDPGVFALGVVGVALLVAALGAALEVGLLRRLYRAPELFQLLATFGLVLVAEDVVLAVWGPDDLALPRPRWLRAAVPLLGERFPAYDLALIAVGPAVLFVLWLLFALTRWGVLVRAATENRDMVAALGVDQRWLFTGVFALGAGLAGLGGALGLPDGSANPGMDLSIVTDAFVVVVVGGLGSVPGAYLAAVLVSEMQAFGIAVLPQATLVVVFVVMAAVLVVRPQGLLGRARGETAVAPGAAVVIRPAPWPARVAGAVLLAGAVAAPLVAGPYALSVLTEALVAVLFAASLHLAMGPGGMASFGHAAWFGLGAYAAALAAHDFGAPMLAALAAGPVVAGGAALAAGVVLVRLSGIALAMLTLALAQVVWGAATGLTGITGGDDGVLGVWPPLWAQGAGFYWLALALCAGGTLALRRVAYAPLGYGLRAGRDAAARAEASGLDTARLRLAAFVLAGAAAGLAGAVFAYAKGSVFPGYAGIPRSVDALLMVLLGGVQTASGPVVGALAYTGLYDALLATVRLWRLALGVAIIALVLVAPEGIAGASLRVWRRWRPL
jgi:branched-chain amino acid transport system permease protein